MNKATVRAARSRLRRGAARHVFTWESPSGTVHIGLGDRSIRAFDPQPTVRAATTGGK